MKRIGYDADTQTYTFQDADGSVWKGAAGAEYSEMTKGVSNFTLSCSVLSLLVSDAPSSSHDDDELNAEVDLEAAPRRSDGYQPLSTDTNRPMAHRSEVNVGAFRTLFPFFLIIGVVLLLIWRLVLAPSFYSPKNPCPTDTIAYWVHPGDSCWAIATEHGCTLDVLRELNPKVDCETLMPGKTLCLPLQTQ